MKINIVFKNTEIETYFSGKDDKWINNKVAKEIWIDGVKENTIIETREYLIFDSDNGKYKIPIENILYSVLR